MACRYAGIDWAADKHDVLVADETGEELLEGTYPRDEKGLIALHGRKTCSVESSLAVGWSTSGVGRSEEHEGQNHPSRGTNQIMPGAKTDWPKELASIGAIRFGRTYYHYNEAVHFFGDLIGLPLYEQFEGSYGENGSIFGLPDSAFTFEVVQGTELIPVSGYDALCLYFPDQKAQQAAMSRLEAAGVEPSDSHPYWVATGGITYRDPDGRQVVFAPFIYGKNEPAGSSSGKPSFPAT